VIKLAPSLGEEDIIVVNLSGRGDKDLFIAAGVLEDSRETWLEFLKSEVMRLEGAQ
jgi:tryptophan synthase beta chain